MGLGHGFQLVLIRDGSRWNVTVRHALAGPGGQRWEPVSGSSGADLGLTLRKALEGARMAGRAEAVLAYLQAMGWAEAPS